MRERRIGFWQKMDTGLFSEAQEGCIPDFAQGTRQ
jgi:hypothetical protein